MRPIVPIEAFPDARANFTVPFEPCTLAFEPLRGVFRGPIKSPSQTVSRVIEKNLDQLPVTHHRKARGRGKMT